MCSPAQTQHFENHGLWVGLPPGRWRRVVDSLVVLVPAAIIATPGQRRCLALDPVALSVGVVLFAVILSAPEPLGVVAHLGRVSTVTDRTVANSGLEPLIGVRELSAWIGVPVATIYEWRTRGEGPVAHRFGKHLRYALADVEAWIASHREDSMGLPFSHPHDREPVGLRIQHPHDQPCGSPVEERRAGSAR